jgi:hypothetical protein
VLCIVKGPAWGWTSAAFVGGTVVALALLGAFLQRCRTHAVPVVELSLLSLRPFAVANGVMFLFFAGFGAMLLSSVLFLTGPWDRGPVEAGLMISPGPLTVALLAVHVRHLLPRFGARAVVCTGCLLMGAGAGWWAWQLGPTPHYVTEFLPGMLIGGVGVALTQASLFGVAAGVLPAQRFATGSGVLNMSRQIGLALGVAVLVALLGSAPTLTQFQHGWGEMLAGAVLAAAAALALPGLPARARAPIAEPARAG